MNNKIKFLFLIGICFLFMFPITISAATIKNTVLGYGSHNYYTKGISVQRNTTHLARWNLSSGERVFCVQPTRTFHDGDTVSGYTPTTNAPETWKGLNVGAAEDDLKKVLSCWDDSNNSIVAAQAIIWELVSGERSSIDARRIFAGTIAPSPGQSKTSLYNVIHNSYRNIEKQYESILRCAARFNITPSFAYESQKVASENPQLLTSYDDDTQTFSRTFNISSNTIDSSLLKYYEVSSENNNVKVSKTNNRITVSTSKEYATKSNAIKITLKYTYKNNGTTPLNTDPFMYYVKSGYQALVKGSDVREYYLYVYTGKKPTYQLRVQKKDEDGNAMSGVKFNVYSDANLNTKVGTTTATDSSGWAYLTGIKKVGKYYIQEADTPDGYKTNKKVVNVTVSGGNRTGSNSYATASQVFVNEFMHLNLSKKTIDDTGKEISIPDYTGNSCTGTYTGPVFTLKKDNKDICVQQISAGKYRVASCSASGATDEIRTCDGKFDIEKIESGCYDITEITAPDGYTLPSKPTQQVCVTKGQSATATVMYNGVTGVIFNKITENGNPIDGGKFALQQKVNGVYRDMLLRHDKGAIYVYEEDLKEEDGTYLLETSNGTINVKNLPPGEYRFVEKEAPEGYDAIQDKDSNATFTISDKGIFGSDGKPATDYYQVKLVNQQTRVEGSYDSAELIVTIITGRKVANYTLIIAGLAVILTVLIILRKKFKK